MSKETKIEVVKEPKATPVKDWWSDRPFLNKHRDLTPEEIAAKKANKKKVKTFAIGAVVGGALTALGTSIAGKNNRHMLYLDDAYLTIEQRPNSEDGSQEIDINSEKEFELD